MMSMMAQEENAFQDKTEKSEGNARCLSNLTGGSLVSWLLNMDG